MASGNNNVSEMLDKLKWPKSILCTLICGITIYSLLDLVKYYYSGYPLRESTLILTTLWGIGSIICWLLIDNRIREIKDNIQRGPTIETYNQEDSPDRKPVR